MKSILTALWWILWTLIFVFAAIGLNTFCDVLGIL